MEQRCNLRRASFAFFPVLPAQERTVLSSSKESFQPAGLGAQENGQTPGAGSARLCRPEAYTTKPANSSAASYRVKAGSRAGARLGMGGMMRSGVRPASGLAVFGSTRRPTLPNARRPILLAGCGAGSAGTKPLGGDLGRANVVVDFRHGCGAAVANQQVVFEGRRLSTRKRAHDIRLSRFVDLGGAPVAFGKHGFMLRRAGRNFNRPGGEFLLRTGGTLYVSVGPMPTVRWKRTALVRVLSTVI